MSRVSAILFVIASSWTDLATAAANHPQTVVNATDFASSTLDSRLDRIFGEGTPRQTQRQWLENRTNLANALTDDSIAGYALAARLIPDNDKLGLARDAVVKLCSLHEVTPNADTRRYWLDKITDVTHSRDCDLNQSKRLMNFSIAYDMVHHLLADVDKGRCRDTLHKAAERMFYAAKGGYLDTDHCPVKKGDPGNGYPHDMDGWWARPTPKFDLAGNHYPVNMARLGVAAHALRGEYDADSQKPDQALAAEVESWRNEASRVLNRATAVHNLITDGTWHEGLGYQAFLLSEMMVLAMAEERAPTPANPPFPLGGSKMTQQFGTFVLFTQQPNKPSASVSILSDWVWVKPEAVFALRWAATKHQDPFAMLAADRWLAVANDLLRKPHQLLWYALEVLATDMNVTAAAPPRGADRVIVKEFKDQGSVLFRDDMATSSASSDIVAMMKAGRIGGAGIMSRLENGLSFPDDTADDAYLNYGHTHRDDLGLVIFGRGGWLLPETVSDENNDNRVGGTDMHNSFLFGGVGQVGDSEKWATSTSTGSPVTKDWLKRAPTPIETVTLRSLSRSRVEGHALYDEVALLERSVHFLSGRTGGEVPTYLVLRDRVEWTAAGDASQLFHSMTTSSVDRAWLKLDNTTDNFDSTDNDKVTWLESNAALGINIVAPASGSRTISAGVTQTTANFQEWMHPPRVSDPKSGDFHLVTVSASGGKATFLELLWPTTTFDWPPKVVVSALDPLQPQLGLAAKIDTGIDRWLFNDVAGGTIVLKAAKREDGTDGDTVKLENGAGGDLAFFRLDEAAPFQQTPESMAFIGSGRVSFTDEVSKQTRVLLEGTRVAFELRVDPADRRNIDLTGNAPQGTRFFAPTMTNLKVNGECFHFGRTPEGLATVRWPCVLGQYPDDPKFVSPPGLAPLHECNPLVHVTEVIPGAKVELVVGGDVVVVVAGPTETELFIDVSSLTGYVAGKGVQATQTIDGTMSNGAFRYISDSVPALPTPWFPNTAHECSEAVRVEGTVAGEYVSVFADGILIATGVAHGSSVDLLYPSKSLVHMQLLSATGQLCGQTVKTEAPPPPALPDYVRPRPLAFAAPILSVPFTPESGLFVDGLFAGMGLAVRAEGVEIFRGPVAGRSALVPLTSPGVALTYAANQYLACEPQPRTTTSDEAPRPESCAGLDFTVEFDEPCLYADHIRVTRAPAGARIRVFSHSVEPGRELGDGSAPIVRLRRALNNNEAILVQAQVGACVAERMFFANSISDCK